jgi:hypothetical protein
MPSPIEHKFTRSGGVYGLRPTGRSLEINEETLIITEYVGVSVDDDDVWKITQIDGVSTLVDQQLGAGDDYCVATRVKDETRGYILVVDFDGPSVRINPDRILQTEFDVVVYGGSPLTAGTGSRLLLEDGRSLVVVVPA